MKKSVSLIILLALIAGCVSAQTTSNQDASSPQEMPVVPESSASDSVSWVWALVFIIIGTLVVLPWLSDTAWNIMIRKKLLNELGECKDRDEKLIYYDRLLSSFSERRGMSRFSLMISVTLIIGAVVLYLVINEPNSELLKNTIGVLTGALASIIGFYFGGRSGGAGSETGTVTAEGTTEAAPATTGAAGGTTGTAGGTTDTAEPKT